MRPFNALRLSLQYQTSRRVVSIDRPGATGSHNNTPHDTRFSA
jgi:hypothetical protein